MLLKKQKNVLQFWRDIEIFNLPDLPDKLNYLEAGSPLPWTIPQEALEDGKRRYILYFGKQKKLHITELIEKFTGESNEKPDWMEKVTGDTCMAVLMIEEEGTLSEEGAYLQASYLHGLKCLQNEEEMEKVVEKLEKVQEAFIQRHSIKPLSDETDEPVQQRFIGWKELEREISVLNSLNIKDLECEHTIYCQSIIISKKIKNADTSFLNSFYLDDLNQLINHPKKWNKGLSNYLIPELDLKQRTDLLKEADAFFKTIDPHKMPMGKWPSNPQQGAYAAQLGAMNTALEDLKDGGIMGINGPPGTGKTTLLSDIVADVIVQRAQKLIKANNILMFMPGERIQRESDFLTHFPIKTALFEDAGIVVASNNNAAVENISKELPQRDKIDPSFTEAEYFIAHTKSIIEKESWGLLAVALGNSENRSLFKSNFWFNSKEEKRFSHYLGSLYNNPEEIDHTHGYRVKFEQTKTELTELIREFEAFRKSASAFHTALPKQLADLKEKTKLHHDLDELKEKAITLENQISELKEVLDRLKIEFKETKELIVLHQLGKPSFFFFQKLFNTKSFKQWNLPLQQYLDDLNKISSAISETGKEEQQLKTLLDKNQTVQKEIKKELALIENRIKAYATKKEALVQDYRIPSSNLPDENLYKAYTEDRSAFHKSNPWSSEKLNTLRSNIFLTSLKIHEYAVLSNAKQFRNNINILLEMLDGKAAVSKTIASSVWKTFFFLVPVVSTSLASVSRLFKNLEEDSIGWLLLDEAGQATVQSAAGIINRSKRSIIIGDPLQIEPVVTSPAKLIEILNRPYKNEPIWSPRLSSAQQLTDRISHQGTEMKQSDEEKIWTGFPLRTHRRCADPMFSIANHIAYSDQMVKATQDSKNSTILGPSTWFHVEGKTVENKQVIREEIELLKEKLALIQDADNIFVISPFKSVADKCRMELNKNFPKVKCGTIHTFQGKETDTVFLVLGSDPKSEGARRWASAKPNMLNVALTRAKKHFYVIGNRTLWQSCSNFDYLSAKLP
jgi:superfamily I DNA and/or RNA helicase